MLDINVFVIGIFGIDDVVIAVIAVTLSVISTILSIVLAPTPQKPKAKTLDDIQAPTAEEGREIPVVFGRNLVKSPNCVWYGGLSSEENKEEGVVIGYYYFMTMHLVICLGPVDEVSKIIVGEREPWISGPVTGNAIMGVFGETLFGGKKSEGGVGGYVDVMFGGPDQVQNPYLVYHLGPDVPAFRGVLSLLLRGPVVPRLGLFSGHYFGTTHYIKPWYVEVLRWPAKGWYDSKIDVDGQANPAHIMYEGLTNIEFGMGYPSSVIDDANFRQVADVLSAEGFGLAFTWDRQSSIKDFLQQVVDHIGAVLRMDRRTGLFQIKLIRDDYDIGSLPVLDESNVIELESLQRVGLGDTVNEVVLKYRDPAVGKDRGVILHNLANWQAQGRIVSVTIEMPGICTDAMARRVAMRELRARSACLAAIRLKVNRTAYGIRQGDVFAFNWTPLGIEQMVFRVGAVRGGTLTDSAITIDAVQDVFGLADSVFSETDGDEWIDPYLFGYGLNYGNFYGGLHSKVPFSDMA